MRTSFRPNAILFDFDGTLVNSREAYLEAAKVTFATLRLAMPTSKEVLEIPKRLEQNLALNDIVEGDIAKFLTVYLATYNSITKEKTTPIPHIQGTLARLSSRAKLAITTMRFVSKAQIMQELKQFSLDTYFDNVITALDTRRPKPSPEPLIKAVAPFNVDLADCVVVGDSVIDIRAGKAAGAKTVSVLSGLYSHEELELEKPDLIIEDVTRLPGHVDLAY